MSRRETSPEISGALRRGGRARISRPTPQVSNASTPGFQPEDCRHTAKSSPVRDERKRDERRAQIESRQGRQIIAYHFSGGNPRVPQTTSPVGTKEYEPGAAYEWISVGDERKRDGHCLRIESRRDGRQQRHQISRPLCRFERGHVVAPGTALGTCPGSCPPPQTTCLVGTKEDSISAASCVPRWRGWPRSGRGWMATPRSWARDHVWATPRGCP